MKTKPIVQTFAAFCFIAALSLQAEEKNGPPVKPAGKHPPLMAPERNEGPGEMVKVTFLGVETLPVGRTLASQLGLPVEMGLVVARVATESPAAAALKENDILMKLEDQLLIDAHQLSVLVRAHKEGEEVPLTLYRGGKEMVVKVKLGQREVSQHFRPQGLPPGPEHGLGFFNGELPGPGEMRGGQFPGMEPEDVHNVLRMIGRERHNWFGAPPVHFFGRKNHGGSTMLNLAEGNFVFSDDAGSVEVQANNGQRNLTVKNAKGEITFVGPINSGNDREKLPPEVMARLREIERSEFNDEPGEGFEQQIAVEPPGKIKIGETGPLPQANGRVAAPPSF